MTCMLTFRLDSQLRHEPVNAPLFLQLHKCNLAKLHAQTSCRKATALPSSFGNGATRSYQVCLRDTWGTSDHARRFSEAPGFTQAGSENCKAGGPISDIVNNILQPLKRSVAFRLQAASCAGRPIAGPTAGAKGHRLVRWNPNTQLTCSDVQASPPAPDPRGARPS